MPRLPASTIVSRPILETAKHQWFIGSATKWPLDMHSGSTRRSSQLTRKALGDIYTTSDSGFPIKLVSNDHRDNSQMWRFTQVNDSLEYGPGGGDTCAPMGCWRLSNYEASRSDNTRKSNSSWHLDDTALAYHNRDRDRLWVIADSGPAELIVE